MKKIEELNLIKVWTTEYSYFSLFCFMDGYISRAKVLVGGGFKNIIFKYEKGLATVYRVNEELFTVSKYYAQRSIDDISYLENSIKKSYELSEKITISASYKSTFVDLEKFVEFKNDLIDFLPYYLVFLWTTDGIKNLGYNSGLKSKIEELCLDARHKTETFYPDLEKAISRNLFTVFGSKFTKDQLSVLTLVEIENLIKNQSLPDKSELDNRFELSLLINSDDGVVIKTGEEAKNIIDKIENFDENITNFSGNIAMKGIAKGKVKIIFRDEDMNKFIDGDILVTTMTRPDWLPVMKKSSAYVTDAGGLLCHAAIIAREMKKPCIIGTKIATKVLKDGDEVEVNADTGVVKILKRASEK